MKKILSLILSCIILLSAFPQIVGMAEEADTSYMTKAEYNVIDQLGIFPQSVMDKFATGEDVIRSEFAAILYNIYYFTEMGNETQEDKDWKKEFFGEYYMDEIAEPENESAIFSDTDSSMDFYNEINTMTSMGIMHVDGESFAGNDAIKYVDALESILNLMGAEFYVNSMGGYPEGVMDYGMGRDMYTMGTRDAMTSMDVAKLIYTALDEKVIKGKLVDNAFTFYEDDVTFMEKHLKLVTIQGILSDSGTVSLTGQREGKGKAVIDDKVYNTDLDLEKYLGHKVKAYVSINSDTNNKVCAVESKNTNEVIEIAAKDINKYDDYKITYYEDGRQKTVSLQKNTLMVYNGEAKTSWGNEDFNFEQGSIKVVKNGGVYDVVIIEDYTNILISGFNQEDNIIYNRAQDNDVDTQDATYDLTDAIEAERLTVVKANGEIGSVSDIVPGIAASIIYNGTYAKILCYDRVEAGITVTSVDENDDTYEHYYAISAADANYYVAKSFLSAMNGCSIEINKAYTLYFDNNGMIIWAESEFTKDTLVGYLIKPLNGDDENYLVKMMKEDGSIDKIALADKVKYADAAGNVSRIAADTVKSELVTDKYEEGLIAYKLNGEGKIKEIEIPRTTGTDEEVLQQFGDFEKVRPDQNGNAGYKSINTTMGSFESVAFITTNTKIFRVPVSDKSDNNYSIITKSSLKTDTYYTVEAYNFNNRSRIAPYIVMKQDAAAQIEYDSASTVFVLVDKVMTGLDDDEENCKIISGTRFGYNENQSSVKYYAKYDQTDSQNNVVTALDIAGDTLMSVDSEGKENTYKIKKGDIIRVALDSDGQHITKAELFYGINRENLDFGGQGRLGWLAGTVSQHNDANAFYTGKGYTNPFAVKYSERSLYTSYPYRKTVAGGWRVYSGYVYDYVDGIMELTTKDLTQSAMYDNTSDEFYSSWYMPMTKFTTITVDNDNYSAFAGTVGDIKTYKDVGAKECSKVIMIALDRNDRYMIVIND